MSDGPGVSDEDGDWFAAWVGQHVSATAADDRAASALQLAREVLCAGLRATFLELSHCTVRLLEAGRVPKFANEHTNAIVRELTAMRAEADAVRAAPVHRPGDFGDGCPWCGGANGAVSVPMRANWWQGRVVAARHFGAVTYDPPRVLTCGVLCDRPGCAEGARACAAEQRLDPTKRRPTLTGFAHRLGLSPEQVLAAVREHDRAEGLRAGRALGAAAGAFDAVVRRIRAKAAAHETSEESDRYAA